MLPDVPMEVTYGSVIFGTLFVLITGFAVMVGMDPYTNRRHKNVFDVIIILEFLLVMQNFVEFYIANYHPNDILRTFTSALGYAIRPTILALFAELFAPKVKHTIAWALVGLNAAMHCTAFFTGIVFKIVNNSWLGGPLSFWCLATSGILLAYLVHLLVHKYKKKQIREIIFHAFWLLVVVGGILADVFFNEGNQWVDFVTIATIIASVLSYLWFHQHFVREYETNFIETQRMRLVLSQVQPHFIYNTLSSIRSIEGNPEETKRAITEFANYIRGNLSSLDGRELIPFSEELDFVKDYVRLQQRRFPNRINVIYDITDNDFLVPPLTVQILVENAIKHGILVRYDSGLVIVQTRLERNNHVIVVSDDGVGFDVKELDNTDRVGLRAVRNRLDYYLEGTMFIESEIGHGTDVVIEIPYSAKKKHEGPMSPEDAEKPAKAEKKGKNNEDTDR